jgi:preprotein translocase subunit YajC
MAFDPLTIIMLAVLAVLIFFMFRNTRKRQADQRELQSKVVTGAEVMTNFGLYGTILSIDDEENQVLLETTPGTVLKVHRQTIARVVEPAETDIATDDVADETVTSGEPEFGERVTDVDAPADTTTDKKSDD